MAKMDIKMFAARFLAPKPVVTLYYFVKYRALISMSSEVELTDKLSLGKGTSISSYTKIKISHGSLSIGERGRIGPGCFISSGDAGLHIGKNFICGPNVCISSSNYITDQKDIHFEDQGMTSRGITIGNNVWIGAGSVILDGTVIGDNSVIVANSLVNRRFKPNVVIQGNPAKIILNRSP
jgi:acetyltransferase-like isoleucine patch superfamily enzyme